jgi:hypothetical protein
LKLAVLSLLVLGACVASPTDDTTAPADGIGEHVIDVELVAEQTDDDAVCALAEALPASDACSLVCDPDAFRDRLREDGMPGGNCYQVRCQLSPETSVTVGVCLL